MYHIFICDDEKNVCAQLENYLEYYFKENFMNGDIEVFYSGEALCTYLAKNQNVNLIFLDIELPEKDGIKVGQYLRSDLNNELTEIIYISSKTNYALELFKCRPLDFLIKPLNYNMVAKIMDIVLKRDLVRQKTVTLDVNRTKQIFSVKDIMYFRSDDKKVHIVLSSGEISIVNGKLDQIEPMVPEDIFLRIHKSYLINHIYVTRYNSEWVKMVNGDVINISKSYRTYVKRRLVQMELE